MIYYRIEDVPEDVTPGDIFVQCEMNTGVANLPPFHMVSVHDGIQWLQLPSVETEADARQLAADMQKIVYNVRIHAAQAGGRMT